jgi:hypothetical protein
MDLMAPLKMFKGQANLQGLICVTFSIETIKSGYYKGLTTFAVTTRDALISIY